MSNEEALSLIELARSEVEWEYPMDYAVAFDVAVKALEKQIQLESLAGKEYYIIPKTSKWIYKDVDVMQAVEKQIPMKIIKDDRGYFCPSCNTFWSNYKGNFIDTNFCPNCSQAIDWSDDDK